MKRSAEDNFDAFLAEEVAPFLAQHGFKRRRQAFALRHASNWGVIHFQKSQSNSKELLRFTVNVAIASSRLQKFLGKDPEELPFPSECHYSIRIGELLPDGKDKWWNLSTATSQKKLKAQVLPALEAHAVPAVQDAVSDEALVALWLSGRSPGLTEFQRLQYLLILTKLLGMEEAFEETKARALRERPGDPVIAMHLEELRAGEAPWVVWRKDDHGNAFEVERFAKKAEAARKAAEMEAKGHKQTYWVEMAK